MCNNKLWWNIEMWYIFLKENIDYKYNENRKKWIISNVYKRRYICFRGKINKCRVVIIEVVGGKKYGL